MKVKLMKKLRKRFKWVHDPKHYSTWRIYDIEAKAEIFVELPMEGYYYNERVLWALLKIIGYSHLWHCVKDKHEQQRLLKLNKQRQKFWQSIS